MIKLSQFVLLCVFLCGCAGFKPGLETPEIKLVSLTPIAAEGFQQRFAVGLSIANPNPVDIALQGMSYRIGIAGHDIFSGVANQLPVLKRYSETPVTVEVSASLMNVLALVADLSRLSQQDLTYQLAAKLDVGQFVPAIRINETGPLPFSQLHTLGAVK